MQRLIKAQPSGGFQQIVPPGVLRFLDFARLSLVKGQQHSAKAQGREYVLDIFSGTATVAVEIANGQRQVFSNVGARADVFSGPPVMVYLPPQSSYEITAESEIFDGGHLLGAFYRNGASCALGRSGGGRQAGRPR